MLLDGLCNNETTCTVVRPFGLGQAINPSGAVEPVSLFANAWYEASSARQQSDRSSYVVSPAILLAHRTVALCQYS